MGGRRNESSGSAGMTIERRGSGAAETSVRWRGRWRSSERSGGATEGLGVYFLKRRSIFERKRGCALRKKPASSATWGVPAKEDAWMIGVSLEFASFEKFSLRPTYLRYIVFKDK